MPGTYNNIFTHDRLDPLYEAEDALTIPVNIVPNVTLAKGTVLGQLTSAVNEVQSLAITATGGTYTLTYTDPITGATKTTAALNYNDSAATIASALNAAGVLGASGVGVTGASSPFTITFSGTAYAGKSQALLTVNTASLTGGSATVTRTTGGAPAGSYKAYASGNADGSQTPKGILQYSIVTDQLGQVYIGTQAQAQWGDVRRDIPIYVSGTFDTTRLTGLDANALSAAYWRLISGSVSSGIVRLG